MSLRALRRVGFVFVGALAILVVAPPLASAHPLGNFTVNTYAGLDVRRDRVDVDYVVDMAEIPTFQARPQIDRNGDDVISTSEAAVYCMVLTRALGRPAASGDEAPVVASRR